MRYAVRSAGIGILGVVAVVGSTTFVLAQDVYPWDLPGYKAPSAKAPAPGNAPGSLTGARPSSGPRSSSATDGGNVDGKPKSPSSRAATVASPPQPRIRELSAASQAELARARTQMDYRDWDAAIATLDALLKREPTSAVAYVMRGNAYTAKGVFDDAIADYDRAIQIDNSSITHANRAIAWQRKGSIERAIADLDTSLKLDADNVAALMGRAALVRRAGDVESAIRDYDRALKLRPNDSEIVSLRGSAEHERTARTGAIDPVTTPGRLAELAPTVVTVEAVIVRRAYELLASGALELAIAEFDRALVANPASYVALTGRAQAFAVRQRFTDAMDDLNAALVLNKGFPPIHTIRGLVFLMRGEHARAVAALDEALKLDDSSADAYAYRGAAHAAGHADDAALRDFDRALSINPTMTLALTTRGKLLAGRGEHQRAVADFDRALRLSPAMMATTFNRARSHEALGQIESALIDYSRVLLLKPGSLLDQAQQILARKRIDDLATGGSGKCSSAPGETCL